MIIMATIRYGKVENKASLNLFLSLPKQKQSKPAIKGKLNAISLDSRAKK